MTSNVKSTLGDIKRISLLVGITAALGGAVSGIFAIAAWAGGVQTKEVAKIEHEEIKQRVYTRLSRADFEEHKRSDDERFRTAIQQVNESLRDIKDDLKVIRQRTWDLKEQRRDD